MTSNQQYPRNNQNSPVSQLTHLQYDPLPHQKGSKKHQKRDPYSMSQQKALPGMHQNQL